MTYFNRITLEEVLEEDLFFDYNEYSNLLEDSDWKQTQSSKEDYKTFWRSSKGRDLNFGKYKFMLV